MKDKNHRPELVIEEAATLSLELAIKPGLLPWLGNRGLKLSSKLPVNLVLNGPLWPQVEEALRTAVENFRVAVIDAQQARSPKKPTPKPAPGWRARTILD